MSTTSIPIIDAVRARLEANGLRVYVVDVPERPAFPYVVLWAAAGTPSTEVALDGRFTDIDDTLGVTVTAGTPEGAFLLHEQVRGLLADWRATAPRYAPLRLVDSQAVQVDREVTIPDTDRHPAFAVDLYRVTTEN